ncbi:MAG TPA: hypothetical protein VGA88_01755 [Burkholderiales bacterium]
MSTNRKRSRRAAVECPGRCDRNALDLAVRPRVDPADIVVMGVEYVGDFKRPLLHAGEHAWGQVQERNARGRYSALRVL